MGICLHAVDLWRLRTSCGQYANCLRFATMTLIDAAVRASLCSASLPHSSTAAATHAAAPAGCSGHPMSSVVASPSEQLRRLIVQVFWHQVDPQPELAFPFPNDSFYEVQARLDRIVDTLVADERFKLNELTLEAVDLAEARRHITSVHDDRFFDWLQTVFEKGGRQPVVADIIPPSRYHVRLPSNGNPAHLAGFWGYDSWTPVV